MVGCIKLREHLLWHTRIMGFVFVQVYIFGMVRGGGGYAPHPLSLRSWLDVLTLQSIWCGIHV